MHKAPTPASPPTRSVRRGTLAARLSHPSTIRFFSPLSSSPSFCKRGLWQDQQADCSLSLILPHIRQDHCSEADEVIVSLLPGRISFRSSGMLFLFFCFSNARDLSLVAYKSFCFLGLLKAALFGESLVAHQIRKVLDWQNGFVQSLDRNLFEKLLAMANDKDLLLGINA